MVEVVVELKVILGTLLTATSAVILSLMSVMLVPELIGKFWCLNVPRTWLGDGDGGTVNVIGSVATT